MNIFKRIAAYFGFVSLDDLIARYEQQCEEARRLQVERRGTVADIVKFCDNLPDGPDKERLAQSLCLHKVNEIKLSEALISLERTIATLKAERK